MDAPNVVVLLKTTLFHCGISKLRPRPLSAMIVWGVGVDKVVLPLMPVCNRGAVVASTTLPNPRVRPKGALGAPWEPMGPNGRPKGAP